MNFLKMMGISLMFVSFIPLKAAEKEDQSIPQKCKENPALDMSLRPYQNTIMGENTMIRPIFPGDYESLCPIYTNPHHMRYLGRGITLTQEEAKEHTMRQAKHNEVKAPSYYHWAIIAHGGIAGKIFIL